MCRDLVRQHHRLSYFFFLIQFASHTHKLTALITPKTYIQQNEGEKKRKEFFFFVSPLLFTNLHMIAYHLRHREH